MDHLSNHGAPTGKDEGKLAPVSCADFRSFNIISAVSDILRKHSTEVALQHRRGVETAWRAAGEVKTLAGVPGARRRQGQGK